MQLACRLQCHFVAAGPLHSRPCHFSNEQFLVHLGPRARVQSPYQQVTPFLPARYNACLTLHLEMRIPLDMLVQHVTHSVVTQCLSVDPSVFTVLDVTEPCSDHRPCLASCRMGRTHGPYLESYAHVVVCRDSALNRGSTCSHGRTKGTLCSGRSWPTPSGACSRR